MREIKFRGRLKNSTEWAYGAFLAIPRLCSYIYDVQPDGQATRYLVDEDTVGQYTGAKDINGEESYEGDIIKFYDVRAHELVGVIKWNALACRWYVDCSVRGCPYHVFDARYAFEILGNVHDNPDLLEAAHE